MKIENEKIRLVDMNILQMKMSGAIFGMNDSRRLTLNHDQTEVLDRMSQGQSLSQIVNAFLEKGVLLSFENLTTLVQFLVDENLILNPEFKKYFQSSVPQKIEKANLFEELSQKIFGTPDADPSFDLRQAALHVPFLRSLDSKLLDVFLKNSKLVKAPPGVSICQVGQSQRSLFVLLRGQASILKMDGSKRRLIARLTENAVFGEIGFFLNEPRTADVVTDTECLVLKIKYVPEVYDQIIKTETARHLQKRFWLIHALLKSPLFREIPEDCFDALIFSGELKSFPDQSLICREGDNGDRCYVVVQGALTVTHDGRPIRQLGQGDVFGEVALIMTSGKRTATVRAQSEVLLLEILSEKFYQLLANNLLLGREIERVALARIRNKV